MLTLMKRAKINQKKKEVKLTSKDLAKILNVPYGTLIGVLSGSYNNLDIENKLLEWLKNN